MHEFIYQLESEIIEPENELNENLMNKHQWFFESVSDGVTEKTDHATNIKMFVESLKKYPVTYSAEQQTMTFHAGFKTAYFREDYPQSKELVNDISLDDYMRSEWDKQETETSPFGTYIYHKNQLMKLGEFIRNINEDTPYYLGKTIDYHY